MPKRPTRACRILGCPHSSPCPTHEKHLTHNRHEQGYGWAWVQFREWYHGELWRLRVPRAGLCGARHPSAPATNDSRCASKKMSIAGTVVDHIEPIVTRTHPRFFDVSNLQLLCATCHNLKRQRERR